MWEYCVRLVKGQSADNEDGQALVEYALILGLISIVAIALLTSIGTDVKTLLARVASALASAAA
ncbi:MAG: Flp/Fap pilin component [Gaiellaceae bacterium]|jgi:Flp pilus assembly pilin Flp|nr:Flp/Fap pilin component [Gaiellaceae bacterium]